MATLCECRGAGEQEWALGATGRGCLVGRWCVDECGYLAAACSSVAQMLQEDISEICVGIQPSVYICSVCSRANINASGGLSECIIQFQNKKCQVVFTRLDVSCSLLGSIGNAALLRGQFSKGFCGLYELFSSAVVI